jgi:hypothetical protein
LDAGRFTKNRGAADRCQVLKMHSYLSARKSCSLACILPDLACKCTTSAGISPVWAGKLLTLASKRSYSACFLKVKLGQRRI